MNSIKQKNEKTTRDPNGLIKLGLMVVGFIAAMILVRYLMDLIKK